MAEEQLVEIKRHNQDWKSGMCQLKDLRSPHWDSQSGGVGRATAKPAIFAYIWCNQIDGDIAHSCSHGPGPHNIKVCVPKGCNSKEIYSELKVAADSDLERRRSESARLRALTAAMKERE